MSFEVYHKGIEENERKDQELHDSKEQMTRMEDLVLNLDSDVTFYKNAFLRYVKQFDLGLPALYEGVSKLRDKLEEEGIVY